MVIIFRQDFPIQMESLDSTFWKRKSIMSKLLRLLGLLQQFLMPVMKIRTVILMAAMVHILQTIFKWNLARLFLNVDIGMIEGAVPLDLISFTGVVKNDHHLLEWTTTNEINVDRMIIERAKDAVNFDSIGFKLSLGNNAILNSYQFEDHDVYANEIFYYRLKILDIDGTVSFSNTISLMSEEYNKARILISPNPTQGQIRIIFGKFPRS